MIKIYNKSCYGLTEIKDNSVHALVTDPPYAINIYKNAWDRTLPDKQIWSDCLRVMKPGAYGVVFGAVRMMHRLMVDLEDSGFLIKDVMFWAFLNGMPKSRDVSLDIDKELGVASTVVGEYNYVQGYQKGGAEHYSAGESKKKLATASELGKLYKGSGLGIKPAYEPIILIQKPLEKGLNVAQNIIKYGTGCLNLEETRIPYGVDDKKVGHNPHPVGRVASSIIRTDAFDDGYDKFFLVPKVRQSKDDFNTHPTLKPVALINQLCRLVSFDSQHILDPFMGSGTTGASCAATHRNFVGYELEEEYFNIAKRRLGYS